MAEQPETSGPEQQSTSGGGMSGGLAIISFAAATLAMIVTWPLRVLTSDKALNGFFKQGLHELGNTFGQMSPDSNTVHPEPGGIWNPLQSDIAGDDKPFKHFYSSDHAIHSPGNRPPSPGEIARSNPTYDSGQSKGHEQDNGLEP
jgi:hypothetical protein